MELIPAPDCENTKASKEQDVQPENKKSNQKVQVVCNTG